MLQHVLHYIYIYIPRFDPHVFHFQDVSEVKSWERAIRMCKYLLNATDREAQIGARCKMGPKSQL